MCILSLKVKKKCSLSPGKFTLRRIALLNKKRRLCKIRAQSREGKKRRLNFKMERKITDAVREVKEGPSYSSNIAIQNPHVNVTKIPSVLQIQSLSDHDLVFFDLETTGLQRNCDIVQISAVCNDKCFNKYILPNKTISPGPSQVTELSVMNNELYYKGEIVKTVPIFEALVDFLEYLTDFQKPVLFGHNIASFDAHVLWYALNEFKMVPEFCSRVTGLIDTKSLAKKYVASSEVANFKQETLVRELLNISYEAHNAINDVKNLQKLTTEIFLPRISCSADDISELIFQIDTHKLKASLKPVVDAGAISVQTQTKLAKTGLGLAQLRLAFERNNVSGIKLLLGERVCGHARVSKSPAVVKKISDFVSSYDY